jgi:ParB-like nuclease domain
LYGKYCSRSGEFDVTPNSKTPLEPSARSPLSVAYLPLDRVRPDPGNARRHSEKQIRQIARSIETFGFNVPILVDGGGNVVAGHGRLAAARRLGRSEIPTIRLEHLTEAQKRAFRIADNRLAEVAEWDDRRLGEELKALAGVELDFDLEAIGFETDEIDLRIESLNAAERCNDEPPILAAGPSVSRAGDLWRLGPHELLCGGEPRDCDAIVRRWQADTGGNARHGVSGASFDEMARLRAASVIARSSCDEATPGAA